MNTYENGVWVNSHLERYGNGVYVKSKYLTIPLTVICLVTFGTNFLIPIIFKYVKGFWLRY